MEGQQSSARASLKEIREIERRSGPEAAERAIIDYLRVDQRSAPAFVLLSRILLKQQRPKDAIRAAEKAKQIAPLQVAPVLAVGFVHVRTKDYDQAAKAFADAIVLEPTSARAHLGAAAVKMMTEDYPAALDLCRKVLELDPSLEPAEEMMARIYVNQGESDKAIKILEGLVIESPMNDRAARGYIKLMRSLDRGAEAFKLMLREADAHPDDRRRAVRCARVAFLEGKPDIGVAQAKKFIDAGSIRIDDRLRYISALIEAERFDAAGEEIVALGEKRIYQPVVVKLRGDIAYKQGRLEKAISQFRLACRKARVEALPTEVEDNAETIEERAKIWRIHSRKEILTVARDRRMERA